MKKPVKYRTLEQYVELYGQAMVAEMIGVTPGAVSLMLRDDRSIVIKKIKGVWHYQATSPWQHGPRRKAA